MTDSEKLDFLVFQFGNLNDNVTELRADMATLKTDVANLKTDVAELKTDVANMKLEMTRMNGEINGLKAGQKSIRMDIKEVKDKLEATYQIALEAWGNSMENRVLLTQS